MRTERCTLNILSLMTEKLRILEKLRLVLTFFSRSEILSLQGRKPIIIFLFFSQALVEVHLRLV